jgi:hypothetical protein
MGDRATNYILGGALGSVEGSTQLGEAYGSVVVRGSLAA